jgi:hypothetical protein
MTDIGRSRRLWRQSFFILLGASLLVIGILLIARSDRKVSYARESGDAVAENVDIVAGVLVGQQPPPTRSSVLRTLRHDNPRAKILATDTTVSIGSLTFHFAKAGRLERVTTAK